MKIAILGTRGVPNYYGGFEQFAEFFCEYLANKGHDVHVYSSHNHQYQEKTFKGAKIIHKYDPEYKIGTAGQFIYDFNCIIDSRKRNFDIILQLGYTSSAIWSFLLPRKSIIIINMDGLEWKRSKFSRPVQKLLKFSEKLAVRSSDYLVADSIGIQNNIALSYNKKSTYIAYGATVFDNPNIEILKEYNLEKNNYNLILARLEPENNIEIILDGVVLSQDSTTVLIIGNHNTKFGYYLKQKFKNFKNINFVGAIYKMEHLNNLRYYSNFYFHGHSVGGTNPSLLEAMASRAFILAHDNCFNKSILRDNSFYFTNAQSVCDIMKAIKKSDNLQLINNNYNAIINDFNWNKINGQYLKLFQQSVADHKARDQK